MKKLNKQELYDILYGCTILGTGGGGLLDEGIKLIDKGLEMGKEFILANLDEVNSEDLIAVPYYCGAISPETEEIRKKYENLPIYGDEPTIKAMETLEKHMEKEIKGVISTELGGGNTAIAFYTGAMMNKYIVDGDPAGRSVPGLQHTTYFINGLPITPIALANHFGETAIFTEVVNDFRAEELVRAIAVVSKNTVGVADHPVKAGKLRDAVIKGAISYSQGIGEAFRNAKDSGKNVSEEVAKAGGGAVTFEGVVEDFEWNTVDGFTIGNVVFRGIGKYKYDEYRIWFQNENIISWLNKKPYITVPDLICVFNSDTSNPINNPYYEKGMRVSICALPAPKEWQTKKGLDIFGPKSFNYDIEYVPMFNLIK